MISVIVPVYNCELFLKRCIDSIINQTFNDLEIILVDDGSTDRSGIICDEYSLLDRRIRVIHQQNRGQAVARNNGLALSKGNYISFVDSDDWIEPTMLENLHSIIVDNSIAVCGRYNVDEKSGKKTVVFCPNETLCLSSKEAIKHFLLTDNLDASPCDKLFTRKIIENLSFPSGFICEDLPFVFDALMASSFVIHTNSPLYNYFQRKGSTSKSDYNEKTIGLIKYSKLIYDKTIANYPNFKKEATIYYSSRLLAFLKMFYDSNSKGKPPISYHLSDFKYLKKRDRIIAFTMKIGIYSLLKRIKNRQ